MTDSEKLMYKIMGSMYQEQIPLVFKGALITKLILSDNSYNDLSRATKDIDANWVAEPPKMAELVKIINTSLSKLNGGLHAEGDREYDEKQSAGVNIYNMNNKLILKMDIDIKVVNESCKYWYGELSFNGATVSQIMCDKLASISGDRIFRRIKDLVDVYALSQCTEVKTVDINKTAEAAGREIGNFNMFLSKQLEIEHAYGKLKGINGKPPFEDIYLHLKKFISPFLDKEKSMVWNSRTQVWYPDESRTIKDWKNQIDQEKQKKENKQYLREQQKNFPER